MFRSLLLLLSLIPVIATADTFYVEPIRPGTVTSGTVDVLVKDELMLKGHAVSENKENSQWVLSPNTTQLGESYIVSLAKSHNGRVVYFDRMKSINLDDLDTIIARLVSGALGNTATAENIAVDTVTKEESIGTVLKTKVTKQKYLGFGPSRVTNLGTNNAGSLLTAGALWGVDHQFGIRAGFTMTNASSSPADITQLSIGGNYYLNRKKHSPYFVGLFGYTWAESHNSVSGSTIFREGKSESGWGAEAGVGMHIFRTASVNIAAELTYNQTFFKVTDDSAPGALSAKLIVMF